MINIKHFLGVIGEVAGVTNDQANDVIKEMVERIISAVDSGETVNISGLGQFRQVIRKGRKCRNPITNDLMTWEDTPVVKYSPASRIKQAIRE